jgi:hypothetical protein
MKRNSSEIGFINLHGIESKKQGMVPHHARIGLGVRVMVFNATFNNILVILLRSVSLVKETGEQDKHMKRNSSEIGFINLHGIDSDMMKIKI